MGDESHERNPSVLLVVLVVPKRILGTTEVVGHLLRRDEVLSTLEGEAAMRKPDELEDWQARLGRFAGEDTRTYEYSISSYLCQQCCKMSSGFNQSALWCSMNSLPFSEEFYQDIYTWAGF